MSDETSARERLAALESAGARAFDPEGVAFIERLVSAGLCARAEPRLTRLAEELEAERVRLSELEARCLELGGTLDTGARAAKARGELRAARRLAARTLGVLERSRGSAAKSWALMLAERARSRELRLPTELATRLAALEAPRDARSPEEARAVAAELSRAMFDESVSSARATVALARARGNVPEGAGPYNPRVIASEALSKLAELSPAYAQAVIASLDDLAELEGIGQAAKSAGAKRRRN